MSSITRANSIGQIIGMLANCFHNSEESPQLMDSNSAQKQAAGWLWHRPGSQHIDSCVAPRHQTVTSKVIE